MREMTMFQIRTTAPGKSSVWENFAFISPLSEIFVISLRYNIRHNHTTNERSRTIILSKKARTASLLSTVVRQDTRIGGVKTSQRYEDDNLLNGCVVTLQKFEELLRQEVANGNVNITESTIETDNIFKF